MENTNIEEMPLSELEGEALETVEEPMALSAAVVQSLASALTKIETYVPTIWVDNTEPDIDADHLNHAEQAIMRVTNLMNGAVDVIQDLQSQLDAVNSNLNGSNINYADAQSLMDGIYNWIISAPVNTLVSKNVSASFGINENISGQLYGGTFQLIAYRYNNYACIIAMSYWDARKALIATIQSGTWTTRFEKIVTNSDLNVFNINYNADTNRTDTASRKAAIEYICQQYLQTSPSKTMNAVIRYSGGYYYSYYVQRYGADVNVLEISPHDLLLCLWTGTVSDMSLKKTL